jgi:acyl dehydratase
VERAQPSPLGSTIAHGFLTVSLLPRLLREVCAFSGLAFGVNHGLNRVRFPEPAPVGSKLRARARCPPVARPPEDPDHRKTLTTGRPEIVEA